MGADRVVAINVGDLSDREGVQLHDVRRGREHARRDDARLDQARARRRRTCSSTSRSRSTDPSIGGAPPSSSTKATSAAEAMRDQLLPLAVSEADFDAWRRARQGRRRTELPAPGVHPGRRFRHERHEAAEHAARPARGRAAEHHRGRSGRRHRGRAGPLRNRDLAPDPRRRARVWLARAGPRQALRAAVHDARCEPREHHVERFPHHRDRALSRLRRRRVGLGAARRRHHRFGPERGASSCTGPSAGRPCSWRRTRVSARRRSTSSTTTR